MSSSEIDEEHMEIDVCGYGEEEAAQIPPVHEERPPITHPIEEDFEEIIEAAKTKFFALKKENAFSDDSLRDLLKLRNYCDIHSRPAKTAFNNFCRDLALHFGFAGDYTKKKINQNQKRLGITLQTKDYDITGIAPSRISCAEAQSPNVSATLQQTETTVADEASTSKQQSPTPTISFSNAKAAIEYAREKYLHPTRGINITSAELSELIRIRCLCMDESQKRNSEFLVLASQISAHCGRHPNYLISSLRSKQSREKKKSLTMEKSPVQVTKLAAPLVPQKQIPLPPAIEEARQKFLQMPEPLLFKTKDLDYLNKLRDSLSAAEIKHHFFDLCRDLSAKARREPYFLRRVLSTRKLRQNRRKPTSNNSSAAKRVVAAPVEDTNTRSMRTRKSAATIDKEATVRASLAVADVINRNMRKPLENVNGRSKATRPFSVVPTCRPRRATQQLSGPSYADFDEAFSGRNSVPHRVTRRSVQVPFQDQSNLGNYFGNDIFTVDVKPAVCRKPPTINAPPVSAPPPSMNVSPNSSMSPPTFNRRAPLTKQNRVAAFVEDLRYLRPIWDKDELKCAERWLEIANDDPAMTNDDFAMIGAALGSCMKADHILQMHGDLMRRALSYRMKARLGVAKNMIVLDDDIQMLN